MSLGLVALAAVAVSADRLRLRWLWPPAVAAAAGSSVWGVATFDLVLAVSLVIEARSARGHRRRVALLPEFADAVARLLDQGRTLDAALHGAAVSVPGVAIEFEQDRTVSEQGGPAMGAGLDELGADAAVVLAALELADRDRANGVTILRSAAAVARARRLRRLDVDTQASSARASTMVIAAVPWCVAGVAGVTGDLSLVEHIGHLAWGSCLSLAGVWWSMRLVERVEVDA